jgi:transcriptional regulator with XRE-family HTH domain
MKVWRFKVLREPVPRRKPLTDGPGQGRKAYDIEWLPENKWALADYLYIEYYKIGYDSLRAFSKACGFANGTLDKFESGISKAISMDKFIRMAEVLGVDPKQMAIETKAVVNVPWPSNTEAGNNG